MDFSQSLVTVAGVTLFMFGFIAGYLFRGVARLLRAPSGDKAFPVSDRPRPGPSEVGVITQVVRVPPVDPAPVRGRHAADNRPTEDLRSRVRPMIPGL